MRLKHNSLIINQQVTQATVFKHLVSIYRENITSSFAHVHIHCEQSNKTQYAASVFCQGTPTADIHVNGCWLNCP